MLVGVALGTCAVSVATMLRAITVSVALRSGVATSTLTRMCPHPTRIEIPTRMRTSTRANLSLSLLSSLLLSLFSTSIHILPPNGYACANKCYEPVTVLSPFLHIAPSLRNQVF